MKKLFSIVVVAVFAVSILAAQSAPGKILSPGDVDTFIANYTALEADLDALEGKYDYIFDPFNDEQEDTSEEIGNVFMELRSIDVPGEIQEIFKKHGMGASGFEKMVVIMAAYQSIEMEEQLGLFEMQFKDNPEMMPYLEEAKQQNVSLRKALHKGDIDVVNTRLEGLRGLFVEEE